MKFSLCILISRVCGKDSPPAISSAVIFAASAVFVGLTGASLLYVWRRPFRLLTADRGTGSDSDQTDVQVFDSVFVHMFIFVGISYSL